MKTWDILLWTSPSFANAPVKLLWWGNSGLELDVPDWIGDLDYWYRVEVIQDPTGQHGGFNAVYTDVAGTSAAPAGSLYWSSIPVCDPSSASTNAIRLRFTAEPLLPVPEPSGLVALAAGIVPLSVLIRRKRAA